MQKTPGNYWKLFCATFTLSAFTFGGGYVIVPLMQKRFVEGLRWMSEEEMTNIVAMGQSSPGAIAINTSILAGWHLFGALGAGLSLLGTVLPPLLIISVIAVFYRSFSDNAVVAAVLRAMQAGVAALIFDAMVSMVGRLVRTKKLVPLLLFAAAFLARAAFGVNIAYILLFCGMAGALIHRRDVVAGKESL